MGFATVGGWAGGGETGELAGQDITANSYTATAATNNAILTGTGGNTLGIGQGGLTGWAFNNQVNITASAAYTTNAGSGVDGFKVNTSGARWHFGAGANDYASSDGTTVTFAGPITSAGTIITTSNTIRMDGSAGTLFFNNAAATTSGVITSNTSAATATATVPAIKVFTQGALDATDAVFGVQTAGGAANLFLVDYSGKATLAADLSFSSFTDDSATTGSRTVNSVRGISAFGVGATTITITNSFVTATSTVLAVIQTADATARITSVVPGVGSFALNTVATTGASTKVSWVVIN